MKLKNILLLIVICASSFSLAQNYNDALLLSQPGIYTGARALGMGNSYTALSDDFSGVIFNPAGLGLAKKFGMSLGVNGISYDNNAKFFGDSTSTLQNTINLSQFGFVFPLPTVQGSLVFALGYNRVKEFNSVTEFNGFNGANNSMIQHMTGDVNEFVPFTNDIRLAYEIRDPHTESYIRDTTLVSGLLNQSGRTRVQGSIGNWSFAGATEVAKGLFIGGTFNIISGSYKRDRDYFEDDTKNNYGTNLELVPGDNTTRDFQTFYLNDIIEWDLGGWDFKLGFLYNLGDILKFAGDVKFPSHYNIKESYYILTASEFGTNNDYELNPPYVDEVEYEIRTPYEFSAGASLKLLILTVSGSVKIIDYTQMKFTEGLGAEYRIERNKEITDLFRTAATYNLGAELKVPYLPIWGRIGAMYIQSPYADDPVEFDRKYLTVGAGIMLGNIFKIDVAYAYGWWDDFSDNYGSNVSRVQKDITVQNYFLNISTALN
ncbi:MAG: hypothetical protein JSW63_01800 [Ignavibacterium sp.]|nr:MAG: hypothetical protein JSW63_01800 [Ignavibacterium sp.]